MDKSMKAANAAGGPGDATAKRRAIEQGIAEADANMGVPHDLVTVWLKKLARGQRLPPPIPPVAP